MATRLSPTREEELLAMAEAMGYITPEDSAPRKLNTNWSPRLNPVQNKAYLCKARYMLLHGERASGKSVGALHKIVRHCVHNRNALAFILVKEAGQALQGGAWHKLQTEILPQWRDGNYDRKRRKLLDKGCGIEFTTTKQDAKTKNEYIWISNKFGGYSMIMMASVFVASHVADKIKGREPSMIMVDEAQTLESDDYFKGIVQQLGRRQDADEEGQIIYCANPKGPSHWLYKRFFQELVDGELDECMIDEETGDVINPSTKKARKNYAVFHVPISENKDNLPPGYWENVLEACGRDEIEYARMIRGEWIDQPEGDAIFANEYEDKKHLIGNFNRKIGILPVPGYSVDVGWDPGGSCNTSIHFAQHIITPEAIHWPVFDELNFVGRYYHFAQIVECVIKRMQYWEEKIGPLKWTHISDSSAFDQFRANTGSYDAADILAHSKAYVERNALPERFIIKLKPCPKGPHSVEARVRLARDVLTSGTFKLSAMCQKTRQMFMQLPPDDKNPQNPKRCQWLHPFDSLTYILLYYGHGMGKRKLLPETPSSQEFFVIGR